MKCMSRSTLGVTIGSINIFGFSLTIVYVIKILCDFANLTEEEKQHNEDFWSTTITLLYIILLLSVIAIIISSLLIVGIVKRRHSLMKPWIYGAIAGIVCHIVRFVIGFFSGFLSGAPYEEVFLAFFEGLLTLGLQIIIFYPIYKLFKDIRDMGSAPDHEETGLNDNYDKPPSYGDLERKGQL